MWNNFVAVPSPLDSGLVKALLAGAAGAVDEEAFEDAVNQQLIHGGSLDTLLLEADVVDEPGLLKALSTSSGTAPVDAARFAHPDAAAVARLPRRMAVTMGLVPLFIDGDGLHVACRSPLDGDLMAEVAGLLQTGVVPHVVPEVRLRQGLAAAYDDALDERFVALLRRLSPELVLDARGVSLPPGAAIAEEPVVDWDLSEALAHLAAQDSRDGIARVAVAFARRFLPFSAVFGVKDGAAIGWLREGPSEGLQFQRPLPIPPRSFLDAALQSASPALLTPEASGENAAVFGWLGRRRPKTALVVPIVVARRPVAVLYSDGGIRHKDPRDVAELTAFGARLGAAFEALLRQRHRQHPSIFPQPAPSLPPQPVSAPSFSAPQPSDLAAATLIPHAALAEFDDDDLPAPPPLPELPAPPTALAALDDEGDDDDLPAPPPLSSLMPLSAMSASSMSASSMSASSMSASSMSASSMSMSMTMTMTPAMPGPHLDGTSPFARSDRSQAPGTSAVDDDHGPLVLTGMSPALNEHLPRPLPPPEAATSGTSGTSGAAAMTTTSDRPFFPFEEGRASEAWRGALHATVERGLQGGTVPDEDLDWESVVSDPAHAAEPGQKSAPTTTARHGERAIDFPALSSNVLHDLYDRDRDGAIDDDAEARVEAAIATAPSSASSSAPDGEGMAPPLPPLPTISHAELVELLFAADDALVLRAAKELVSRGLAVVPALGERFPGRLRVDPFDVGENVRTAERLGPLLEVLARLGKDGLDAAVAHVYSRHPAHRFAAVLLFALTPDARAIDLLRSRLHDAEPRIQRLAAEALVPFLAHPRFETLLAHLRERTTAVSRPYPLEARRRAAELLGEFRDVGAVPLLMGLLSSSEMAETARKALRGITLVDHGARPKGWEKWWQRAKKRSRIDWLIDALSSEELELRNGAWRELQGLVGDDFGYRPDADKRARQRAIEVWQQWWLEEQKAMAHPRTGARL